MPILIYNINCLSYAKYKNHQIWKTSSVPSAHYKEGISEWEWKIVHQITEIGHNHWVTLRVRTNDSKFETERQIWWPLGRCLGSATGDVALHGPSESFELGFLSMRWRQREAEGCCSQTTLKSPNSGLSISSNPNICSKISSDSRINRRFKQKKEVKSWFEKLDEREVTSL